ncbi:MAG TPA: ATP-binding cassette domain-containing protein [Solirubrobacteraceae bacterium]|nr:ATP-binding cassette domain-containing protein [Solirubrobacteraceae bacterium]
MPRAGPMDELLRLSGVGKRQRRGEGSVTVLADVSLAVAEREIGAVVGSPGSGKTTLLEIAAGMVCPDGGGVCFGGVELNTLSRRERERLLGREIAWTDRQPPRLPWSIRDHVGLPLATGRGHGSRELRELAGEALERLGVHGGARRRWVELSDWEQVLVGFARVAVCRPRLALIDGLFDGLGRHKTQQAGDLLRDLVDELGCSVLISASDLQNVLVAERVWELERRGRLRLLADRTTGGGTVVEFPASAARGGGGHGAGA